LIETIAGATRQQSELATKVARKMQDILLVTGQTTAGTQKDRDGNWRAGRSGDGTERLGCRFQSHLERPLAIDWSGEPCPG
jgi:hypothetical protein